MERLQQIQEEQRRLEDERRRQEESIRLEQASSDYVATEHRFGQIRNNCTVQF